MTSNHWNYSYVVTFSQFPCYDVIIFQSQKVCNRSAHYSVAKALEESSLAIDEKIFFLSGNTKETNVIKIMNNPDSLERNLLDLIFINILKKKKLWVEKIWCWYSRSKLFKKALGELTELQKRKYTEAYHKTLSACMWFFFWKHKFRDKITGNCDRF